MRKVLLSMAAVAVVFGAAAAESELPATATGAASQPMSIDTPILELLLNATTRPVVEKHLPRLAERLLNDASAAELLGASSPRELALDPHVRGITDEMLKQLQVDLDAAQN
jgi:hypothetical protein